MMSAFLPAHISLLFICTVLCIPRNQAQNTLMGTYQIGFQYLNPAHIQDGRFNFNTNGGYGYSGENQRSDIRIRNKITKQDETGNIAFSEPKYLLIQIQDNIKIKKLSLGLSYLSNQTHFLGNFKQFAFTIAKPYIINSGTLSFGVHIKLNYFSLEASRVNKMYRSFYELQGNKESFTPNFDFGFQYVSKIKKTQLGVSILNVISTSFSVSRYSNTQELFYNSESQALIHFSTQVNNSGNFVGKPALVLVFNSQLKHINHIINYQVTYKKIISLGVQHIYKSVSSIGPMLGFSQKHLALLYAYQIPFRNYRSVNGFHEIGLHLRLP